MFFVITINWQLDNYPSNVSIPWKANPSMLAVGMYSASRRVEVHSPLNKKSYEIQRAITFEGRALQRRQTDGQSNP